MATDKLINQSQGDDIINALDDIATNVGNLSYGEQTSSDKVVAMTGYEKASTAEAISQADTLNEAIGKLEKKIDDSSVDDKVDGPDSATIGNIAVFDNVDGKSIDDSGISVKTSLDNSKDTEVPTSKAIDTYITNQGFAKGVSTSTADNLVAFNTTDGKTLKDSGVGIATSSAGIGDSDTAVPTSKAVKNYVDATISGTGRYLGTATAVTDLSTSAKEGDYYVVSTAWTGVHVCDVIIAKKNNPSQSIDDTNWSLLHNESNTDANVEQSPVSTNAEYEVLFSHSANNTSETSGVGKDDGITYNPSTNNLTLAGTMSAAGFTGTGVDTATSGSSASGSDTKVPSTKKLNEELGSVVKSVKLTSSDANPITPTNNVLTIPAFVGSGTGHKAGLVPDTDSSTAGTTKYLREDGSWVEPTGDNLKLTGYEIGSQAAAVAATDTINEGIGKLEYKVDANQTNISSLQDAVDTKLDKTANAASAAKLNNGTTDYTVGSATKGVYFNNGVPTEMTYSVGTNVPAEAVFTDTTYSDATTSASGLMSATDKSKLNGIATGATAVSESTVSGWGFTKNTGTYSKPSTGIPKTDLATAVQTSLGKADSALQSHQTIKQDGITGATVNRFGTCSTAAATAAKTVSITSGTFNLEAGARVSVKFTNANTADTPTLNVNSKGAKNIYSKGSQITTGSNKSLLAGTVDFIYDGTQWHLIGNYIDTNTTYSSKSAASGGTDVSLCTTGEKYTWNSKAAGDHTHPLTLAADSGTVALTLAHNTGYKLTAGGNSFIFKTPADNNTYPSAYCSTAAATAAKVATCTGYALLSKSYIHVIITTANTSASALTLNINSKGAKPIYINGSASSSSNYTLPAGSYLVYYNGTNYYFRTDGKVTAAGIVDIGGNTGLYFKGDGTLATPYTHPTTAGNKHIPSGGSSGQVLVYGGSSGTAVWGELSSSELNSCKVLNQTSTWESKSWSGLDAINANNIWTDGTNIYYSSGTDQYVLNKSTSTWSSKTWTNLTNFFGTRIWTDGDNIYYSYNTDQYVLNKANSLWRKQTWTGLTSFKGYDVWSDGSNIYYSSGSTQYVLNKSNSTWSAKTWTGLTNFNGEYVWTDGTNIYYSSSSTQYVLNKSNSTWSTKTWTGLTDFYATGIWTDGENIYHCSGGAVYQYVLNKSTSTWSKKTWSGLDGVSGSGIWTDGDNIYYSSGSNSHVLKKAIKSTKPQLRS